MPVAKCFVKGIIAPAMPPIPGAPSPNVPGMRQSALPMDTAASAARGAYILGAQHGARAAAQHIGSRLQAQPPAPVAPGPMPATPVAPQGALGQASGAQMPLAKGGKVGRYADGGTAGEGSVDSSADSSPNAQDRDAAYRMVQLYAQRNAIDQAIQQNAQQRGAAYRQLDPQTAQRNAAYQLLQPQSSPVAAQAKGGKFIQKAVKHKGRMTKLAARHGVSLGEEIAKDVHSKDPSLRGAALLGRRFRKGEFEK